MNDNECVAFLQSVLPRLGLRWHGYRRVRRQVCKRIAWRLRALELAGLDAYRARLKADPAEWDILDSLCRVTISRFYRDRALFDALGTEILPALARRAAKRADPRIHVWSAGCASGEEPYSLSLLWRSQVAPRCPGVDLSITATDADAHMLERARSGCYAPATLRELPAEWTAAFQSRGRQLCLRTPYRAGVAFRQQDIRRAMPDGPFDLVLCRNLAFTYFDDAVQRDVLRRIAERLDDGGYLLIGGHEKLPQGNDGFTGEGLPRALFRRLPRQIAPLQGATSSGPFHDTARPTGSRQWN